MRKEKYPTPTEDTVVEYELNSRYTEKPVLEVLTPTGRKRRNDRIATNFWCKHCGPGR